MEKEREKIIHLYTEGVRVHAIFQSALFLKQYRKIPLQIIGVTSFFFINCVYETPLAEVVIFFQSTGKSHKSVIGNSLGCYVNFFFLLLFRVVFEKKLIRNGFNDAVYVVCMVFSHVRRNIKRERDIMR